MKKALSIILIFFILVFGILYLIGSQIEEEIGEEVVFENNASKEVTFEEFEKILGEQGISTEELKTILEKKVIWPKEEEKSKSAEKIVTPEPMPKEEVMPEVAPEIVEDSQKRVLNYTLRGENGKIHFPLELELKNYLSNLPREYYCEPKCPTETEIELRYLNDSRQKEVLRDLASLIRSKTTSSDDQARIAISLVQKIPYDWEGFKSNQGINSYPYEVIYDNKGVCGEKSKLLAFLLRELDFGVSLISFKDENHMAVGVKCPIQYSFKNTGYCFIEATGITIMTDSQNGIIVIDEAGNEEIAQLLSTPVILQMSDGNSLDSVLEEYNDAQEWFRINGIFQSPEFQTKYSYEDWLSLYDKWQQLVAKYGIEVSE